MSFSNVLKILDSIDCESSRKEKENIIKKNISNKEFEKVVIYALNPYLRFKVTNIEFVKNIFFKNRNNELIFNFLDSLNSQRGVTNQEKEYLAQLSSIDEDTVEVVNRIISKDLKCGASRKTFEKFFDIPSFGVMLAKPMKENRLFLKAANYETAGLSNIVWSIKLDGVRCQCTVFQDGNIEYRSRNGLLYENFTILNEEITTYVEELISRNKNLSYPITLDGEITLTNNKYKDLMTQVKRIKEINPEFFRYNIFDLVIENTPFIKRYEYFTNIEDENKYLRLRLHKHYNCNGMKTFDDIVKKGKEAVKAGFEGLVIKTKFHNYERKKSNHWLKIKFTDTLDVEVIRALKGTPGSKYESVLGAFECKLPSGKIFYCGSGISDEDRVNFLVYTPKIIEVKFQELTEDGIPRFPIFVRVRDDK